MDTRNVKRERKELPREKMDLHELQGTQIADASSVKEIEKEIYVHLNSSFIPEIKKDNIIIKAPHDETTQAQTMRILKEFNKNVKTGESCFTVDVFRGTQIDPGYFWLGVRNKIPELHGESGKPIARTLLPFSIGQSAEIEKYNIKQSDKFYGAMGTYVLNVPSGQYAKANSGNKQLMFGEGCHVIHDPNFMFNGNLVDQNSDYIEHGTIHILRIPAGKICKIWVGSEAFILTGRKDPYVFNSPLLKVVKNAADNSLYFDQNTNYIEHGTTHILRIPVGKLAKIWIGQEARILLGRNEPFVFHEPQFQLVKNIANNSWYFDQNTDYIEHGTTHILRIPVGKLAKIWIGQEAQMLLGQNEPMFSMSRNFN